MYFGQLSDSEPILKSLFTPDSSQGLVGVVGDRGVGAGGSGQRGWGGLERGWRGAGSTYFEHHLINNFKILKV